MAGPYRGISPADSYAQHRRPSAAAAARYNPAMFPPRRPSASPAPHVRRGAGTAVDDTVAVGGVVGGVGMMAAGGGAGHGGAGEEYVPSRFGPVAGNGGEWVPRGGEDEGMSFHLLPCLFRFSRFFFSYSFSLSWCTLQDV